MAEMSLIDSEMSPGWTAVSLSGDLPALTVMPVTVGGVDLALWRGGSGVARAWQDRCPHRGMRLSHGFVRGDRLTCIYHGWSYGAEGACLRIPAHPDLEPPATIRTIPVACREAGGIVWVASGATADLPPDLTGWAPLRSLTFAADRASVIAALGARDEAGILHTAAGGTDLAVLLQARAADEITAHVLVPETAGLAARIGAVRWLETARRRAEGPGPRGIAA